MTNTWHINRKQDSDQVFTMVVEVDSQLREETTYRWVGTATVNDQGQPHIEMMQLQEAGAKPAREYTKLHASTLRPPSGSDRDDFLDYFNRVAVVCSEQTKKLEEKELSRNEEERERTRKRRHGLDMMEELVSETRTKKETNRAETVQDELETFRKRREAWAEAAMRLPHHKGPETKIINSLTGSEHYNFQGAALQSMMEKEPGRIHWNATEQINDVSFQAVDDTTVVISDHYGLSTDMVDHLDDLELEDLLSIKALNQAMLGANYTFHIHQDGEILNIEEPAASWPPAPQGGQQEGASPTERG